MLPLQSSGAYVQGMPKENQQTASLHQSPSSSDSTNSHYINRGSHDPNQDGQGKGQPTGGRTKRAKRQHPGQSLKRSVHRTGGFLNCSTSTTWRRAKELNCLYHNIQKINVPFTVCAEWSTVKKALLDSGAMDNFIDHRTTKRLGIQTEPLKQPIQLTNINRTTNEAG